MEGLGVLERRAAFLCIRERPQLLVFKHEHTLSALSSRCLGFNLILSDQHVATGSANEIGYVRKTFFRSRRWFRGSEDTQGSEVSASGEVSERVVAAAGTAAVEDDRVLACEVDYRRLNQFAVLVSPLIGADTTNALRENPRSRMLGSSKVFKLWVLSCGLRYFSSLRWLRALRGQRRGCGSYTNTFFANTFTLAVSVFRALRKGRRTRE